MRELRDNRGITGEIGDELTSFAVLKERTICRRDCASD